MQNQRELKNEYLRILNTDMRKKISEHEFVKLVDKKYDEYKNKPKKIMWEELGKLQCKYEVTPE